jgi:hypothetical protein
MKAKTINALEDVDNFHDIHAQKIFFKKNTKSTYHKRKMAS